MGAVSGQGTTYNLPNYHGELFTISPVDTPFLSAIGGLNGAKRTTSVEFEWQTEDRRSSSANNVALEGAAAPTAGERSRSNVSNVVEIHQSAINVSYTKTAARGLFGGINAAPQFDDAMLDEVAHQTMVELQSIAVDVEKSFLSGAYQKPANNSTARQTRGILTAISTNVAANGGTPRALTKAIVDNALKTAFDNGARLPQGQTVLMCGSAQKIALSNVYSSAPQLNQATQSRNLGGVAIQNLVTDFGDFGIMLNRWMPSGQIAVLDLSVCFPVFLEIPGKGMLFTEPLAKVGASEQWQVYGEIGIEYGPETYHALIKDLS